MWVCYNIAATSILGGLLTLCHRNCCQWMVTLCSSFILSIYRDALLLSAYSALIVIYTFMLLWRILHNPKVLLKRHVFFSGGCVILQMFETTELSVRCLWVMVKARTGSRHKVKWAALAVYRAFSLRAQHKQLSAQLPCSLRVFWSLASCSEAF